MRNKRKVIIIAIVIAVILMGIGYASLSNITLKINTQANATANEFSVAFDDVTPTTSVSPTGASITVNAPTPTEGAKSATVTFTGLKDVDDTATVTFTIINNGDIEAYPIDIYVTASEIEDIDNVPAGTSDNYSNGTFNFYAGINNPSGRPTASNLYLDPGETTTVVLEATLLKQVVDTADATGTCVVTIKASPSY